VRFVFLKYSSTPDYEGNIVKRAIFERGSSGIE
jgi:hypothetical protein